MLKTQHKKHLFTTFTHPHNTHTHAHKRITKMSTCMRSCVLKRMACRRNYPRLMLLYTVMAAVFIRSIVFDNSSSTTALAFEINPMLTPKVRSTTLPSMKGLRSTSVDDIASSNMRYQLQVPEQTTQAKSEEDKDAYTPYQGEQPKEALSEIFIPQVFSHNPSSIENISLSSSEYEDSLWVPQTDTVSFRPLCFCVSGGYYVNLLRVRGSGLLSRHRHPGPVHGHVLKGKWKYLEHDWVAEAGSYVFEPPGEIHTLVVPEGVDEMITLFHVTGSLLYCDPDGKVTGAEDVFTKLELAKKHYKDIGLGEDFVQQFVR